MTTAPLTITLPWRIHDCMDLRSCCGNRAAQVSSSRLFCRMSPPQRQAWQIPLLKTMRSSLVSKRLFTSVQVSPYLTMRSTGFAFTCALACYVAFALCFAHSASMIFSLYALSSAKSSAPSCNPVGQWMKVRKGAKQAEIRPADIRRSIHSQHSAGQVWHTTTTTQRDPGLFCDR